MYCLRGDSCLIFNPLCFCCSHWCDLVYCACSQNKFSLVNYKYIQLWQDRISLMYIILFVHCVRLYTASVHSRCQKREVQHEKSTLCKYPLHIYVFGFWCSPARKFLNTWHTIPFLFPIKYGRDFTGKVSWPQCSKFDCTTANVFSITSLLSVYWEEAFKNVDHAEGLIHFWCIWLERAYGQQVNFLRSTQKWQANALKYSFLTGVLVWYLVPYILGISLYSYFTHYIL